MTVEEFKWRVEYEGTGYTLLHYYSAEKLAKIDDGKIAKAALAARMALEELESLLEEYD